MKRATAFFDGGVRTVDGRTGPHACSVVLKVEGGEQVDEALYLGESGTVNTAEWNGLILALETALKNGVTHLIVRADSKLIVEQALGNWRMKAEHLRPYREKAVDLAGKFAEVRISHVHREQNTEADALCTALLDGVVGRKRGY